jgi:SAM-dependent methyltransferase
MQVETEISSNDEMYNGDDKHYFSVGSSALNCIEKALSISGKHKEGIHNILDFPCGHGRVLRYLRVAYPAAKITACDVNQDGVDFCAKVFDVAPSYSNTDLSKINLPDDYDLIWCGSLMTHLDFDDWTRVLKLFRKSLLRNGLLVFSTHGCGFLDLVSQGYYYGFNQAECFSLIDEFKATGFAYKDYKGKESYGISISSIDWVRSCISLIPHLKLLNILEKCWDNHHDIIICIKE